LLFQLLDQVADFLGAGTVGDEQGVGCIDDYQVFDAEEGDQLAFGVDVVARAGVDEGIAAEDIGVFIARQQLVDGVPASDVVPAEIIGGESGDFAGLFEYERSWRFSDRGRADREYGGLPDRIESPVNVSSFPGYLAGDHLLSAIRWH